MFSRFTWLCIFAGYPLFASASAKACGLVTCFDQCIRQYITVQGDTCESVYDASRSCFRSVGTCGGDGGGSGPMCQGPTYCWDACSNSYITVPQANTCNQVYDFSRACYMATGSCI